VNNLLSMPASELIQRLRSHECSATEVVQESLDSIHRLDPALGAFISVDSAGAISRAKQLDSHTGECGPLHGLPVAIKDVTDVKGLTTTFGSRLSAKESAQADALSVSRLKAAGAIIVGKTNTPEYAFGAVCTNPIRGTTCNPWNTALTSAGSSGGSAVAVTSGMVSLAQGTDLGGSVRTPAAFTGCVGFRPALGRIPEPQSLLGWERIATQGVLARSIADARLMANVMSGSDARDPLAPSDDEYARQSLPKRFHAAASLTLGDEYAVDDEVAQRFSRAIDKVSVLMDIDEDYPSVGNASRAFCTLSYAQTWYEFRHLIEAHPQLATEPFKWNIAQGEGISLESYLSAQEERTRFYRELQRFFERYDLLMVPSASVMPFPNDSGEVTTVGGRPTRRITDYLECTYLFSLAGFPSISLPAPKNPDELPFGIQLVAKPCHEDLLFSAGALLESEAGFAHQWPPMCLS
jgi:amidase